MTYRLRRWVLVLLLFVGAGSVSSLGAEARRRELPVAELSQEIRDNRHRVLEFAEIASLAAQRGLRVFLFGGTAAGLGQYVKLDALRRRGDQEIVAEKFDFEYTHIFRHNQDLDLVVTRADGKPETEADLEEFESEVLKRFHYGSGEKSEWEVRGLRTARGGKEALLDNPDFLNQHTDSNSTGMIELTDPPAGEAIVQDLRDRGNPEPHFLKDVATGKLHYYFSELHTKTNRFGLGLNPPILSAIRYLTKAVQYGLEIDGESRRQVARIIEEFDPKAEKNTYVLKWIEKNAKKLVQNAVDLEMAWNLIEDLGLRRKLIALKNNSIEVGTLAWWMSREPLRSRPHASAHRFAATALGQTAGELGIDFVTHAAKTFEVYEAITRSPTGRPNLLISRNGIEGESASEGEGAYSLKGREPVDFLPGFAIRFAVDPAAREGVDFRRVRDFVIWQTSNHLKIVPEELGTGMSFSEAIRFLTDPANHADEGVKMRVVRSVSKNPWNDETERQIREAAARLVDQRDWKGLSSLMLLDRAQPWIQAVLSERNVSYDTLITERRYSGDSNRRLELSRILVPMARDFGEFARAVYLTSEERLQSLHGLTVAGSLGQGAKLNPEPLQLRTLYDSALYYVPHTIAAYRKGLAACRNAEDYLFLFRPQYNPGSEAYQTAMRAFYLSTLPDFLKLRPTGRQFRRFAMIRGSVSTREVVEFHAIALRDARTASEFVERSTWVAPTASDSYQVAHQKLMTDELERFFALAPTEGDVRRLVATFHAFSGAAEGTKAFDERVAAWRVAQRTLAVDFDSAYATTRRWRMDWICRRRRLCISAWRRRPEPPINSLMRFSRSPMIPA